MSNKKKEFAGKEKTGKSLFTDIEDRVRYKIAEKFPRFIETYHLTLMTILWSAIIIGAGYMAKDDIQWLWVVSICIFLQYLTDLFDGPLGKVRNTGLVKWGFYMDHFLDYIFLCSVIISYYFIVPEQFHYYLFFILAIFSGFIVNSYLGFAVTKEFRIAFFRIGPTEGRILFIVLNTILIFFGQINFGIILPIVLLASFVGLVIVVYSTQKRTWKIDMETKEEENQK